ncbi:MAG: alpha-galactosidase [Firmicutes bacterium]|nr:alpha-galactosidase [Bacillota bacterium]
MIEKNENVFHLRGKNISYIMSVNECGDLLHCYYGKKLRGKSYDWIKQRWIIWGGYASDKWTLDICPQEYPAYGYTDLRSPAYRIIGKNGSGVSRLTYKSHKITENAASEIEGMPSLFAGGKNAQTLDITLEDKNLGYEVVLSYTVFDEFDIIARNVKITNISDAQIKIDSAYSASADMPKDDYELIYFSGGWGKEREMCRESVPQGVKIDISNARGGSGHNMNPFVMLASKGADENHGEVYSMTLVYSGNHSTMLECDQYGGVRIMQGINPFGFEWVLDSGESFYTPQSIMCYSDKGIGGISRELHDVIRQNLCRGKWADKERPILINNWEATYFDFTEEKLLRIAEKAKDAGIEMFVLDDGWFGKRNDENTSLGDWVVNTDKIPSGIGGLAKKINDMELKFGLWFEPEAVNPDSDIYRLHPDWIVRTEGIEPAKSRHEYLLDLTREDVRRYITDAVCAVLSSANIEYVKWDMNRPMTDMPYNGFNHRFTLGLYKIIEEITSRFPNILFEGCSGGGGRFDAGILAYMPQIWASDNSDAVKRLQIQYSTSIAYPISSISAHVTAVPNHQNGRVTSLKTRGDVAYCGVFGYELDITKADDEEFEEIKAQVKTAKALRRLMADGDFYRLENPYTTNYCAWETAAKDKSEAFVMCAKVLSVINSGEKRVRLMGLDADADYRDEYTNAVYGGDELMYRGFEPTYENRDFSTQILHLIKM